MLLKVNKSRRYVIITPCRDEADFIQTTIDAISVQSVLPICWVIVDDGSTDDTPNILDAAAMKYPFIKVIKRTDRGERAVGPGVIEALNEGLRSIDIDEYDYFCKLDADLGVPPRYFERLMEHMEADPFLGNMSGKTYIKTKSGKWVSERMGDENAIGPAKFYRVACFKDIGGFVMQAGWDGIDGHMCRMKGWIARSVDDVELRLKHYRPQGSSQKSLWTGRLRWGRGKYFMGSSLAYVFMVSVYRLFERPFFIGGVGILFGYLSAMFKRVPRYDNPAYLKFFRRYELNSLIFGKKRTLIQYNQRIREEAKRKLDRPLADKENLL